MLQDSAVPPAERAAQGKNEEQHPGRTAKTHKHPQMEAARGENMSVGQLQFSPGPG